MRPTPTPLDYIWLRRQLAAALNAAPFLPSATIPVRRDMAEMIVDAIDQLTGVPAASRGTRYNWSADELRPAFVAELQRLAADGKAPSKARWDSERDRTLPTSQHCATILGLRWSALAAAAGLTPQRSPSDEMPDLDIPPDLPPDSAPDMPESDGLQALRTRTEVLESGGRRITREYHLLR